MKKRLLSLGNDGNLIKRILRLKEVDLIGVVADEISEAERRYFGSALFAGRNKGVPAVSQKDFNRNYKRHMKEIFIDTDIIFVYGYHYVLKKDIFEDKRFKVINFHQSLLPAYAGRHPLNWTLVNGEKWTGITFHYIDGLIDGGDIILQQRIRISKGDDILSLYKKTIEAALPLLERVIYLSSDSSFVPAAQDLSRRTYFPPRRPGDGELLATDTVERIKNKIRALSFPYPGAFVRFGRRRIVVDAVEKIKDASRYSGIDFIGSYNGSIIIRASDGLLSVTKVRKS